MLKPALARGELHCVGATTLDEYRKYIEKDAALERRFQKVLVDEPSVESTIAILRGLQERYEIHHGVEITDPAIVAAAELEPSVHHRPLPARQGDRPDRRSRRAHQDGDRLEARGDGPARPPDHPAEDRARGGEEGEGRGVEKAAVGDRGRDRAARARVRRSGRDLAGGEGAGRRHAAHQGGDRQDQAADGRRAPQGRLAEDERAPVRQAAGSSRRSSRKRTRRKPPSRSPRAGCCARRSEPKRSPRSFRARPASPCRR